MYSPALDVQGYYSIFAGLGTFFPGETITFVLENGTQVGPENFIAVYNSPGPTGPLETGGDFYNFFVRPWLNLKLHLYAKLLNNRYWVIILHHSIYSLRDWTTLLRQRPPQIPVSLLRQAQLLLHLHLLDGDSLPIHQRMWFNQTWLPVVLFTVEGLSPAISSMIHRQLLLAFRASRNMETPLAHFQIPWPSFYSAARQQV